MPPGETNFANHFRIGKKIPIAGAKKTVMYQSMGAKRIKPSWLVHEIFVQGPFKKAAINQKADKSHRFTDAKGHLFPPPFFPPQLHPSLISISGAGKTLKLHENWSVWLSVAPEETEHYLLEGHATLRGFFHFVKSKNVLAEADFPRLPSGGFVVV